MKDSYKRILLKVSGEFFGDSESCISVPKVEDLVEGIQILLEEGIQVGVVVGGGNIFRKRFVEGTTVDPIIADYMGITGTIINALILNERLNAAEVVSVVQSAWPIKDIVDGIDPHSAQGMVLKGGVVVFAAGTGKPNVTTDTGVVERAIDLKAEMIVKATKVDGVYTKDPEKYSNAQKIESMTLDEALERDVKIMDREALQKAQQHSIGIHVIKFSSDNLLALAQGKDIGTVVSV